MQARFVRRDFHFIKPAVTSRGALTVKETYFIILTEGETVAIGECALFHGLGSDDRPDYAAMVEQVCNAINCGNPFPDLSQWPSILFGLESALHSLSNGGGWQVFPSQWSRGESPLGISINGLVWMDAPDRMEQSAMEKAEAGFRCIKFKVGACDFSAELRMIERLRRRYGPEKVELRLDANGAWRDDSEALSRLHALDPLDIHSIEQPVKARQEAMMQAVIANSPIPVALDEELIGRDPATEVTPLLSYLRPQYVILKPSLCGGFSGAERWINGAESMGIGHWVTSALESNIGLNAIAQWTARNGIPSMPQGLGTGSLYADNIPSPLLLDGQTLHFSDIMHLPFPDL
ncbi:MAG: o-succinylbenzoate synthase [Pseudoflavonifractor sp.]|nr:o-succinylbenzoate synthase [Alloprevotella sp.]MCM1116854.1 o-succinylbenzoate synthase [Pseudoflavonifractor sp.]